jgi:hypothetical protein
MEKMSKEKAKHIIEEVSNSDVISDVNSKLIKLSKDSKILRAITLKKGMDDLKNISTKMEEL